MRLSTRRAWAVVAVALGLGACSAGAPVAPISAYPTAARSLRRRRSRPRPSRRLRHAARRLGLARSGRARALTYALHFAAGARRQPVVDASLSTASGPTPTFEPDRGGDYGVTLTVTTPDGVTGSAAATVTVPTLPLFYYRGSFGAESDTFSVGVVRSDGTGARDVMPLDDRRRRRRGRGEFAERARDPRLLHHARVDPLSAGGASRLAFAGGARRRRLGGDRAAPLAHRRSPATAPRSPPCASTTATTTSTSSRASRPTARASRTSIAARPIGSSPSARTAPAATSCARAPRSPAPRRCGSTAATSRGPRTRRPPRCRTSRLTSASDTHGDGAGRTTLSIPPGRDRRHRAPGDQPVRAGGLEPAGDCRRCALEARHARRLDQP